MSDGFPALDQCLHAYVWQLHVSHKHVLCRCIGTHSRWLPTPGDVIALAFSKIKKQIVIALDEGSGKAGRLCLTSVSQGVLSLIPTCVPGHVLRYRKYKNWEYKSTLLHQSLCRL